MAVPWLRILAAVLGVGDLALHRRANNRENDERLDVERQQLEAEKLRAERLLRLELLRQSGDRELTRLRLIAGVAAASWIGTLFFSARLIGGTIGARVALGAGWALLLASIALAFAAQARVGRALAQVDVDRHDAIPTDLGGAVAPWLIVLGLGLVGIAVLVA